MNTFVSKFKLMWTQIISKFGSHIVSWQSKECIRNAGQSITVSVVTVYHYIPHAA